MPMLLQTAILGSETVFVAAIAGIVVLLVAVVFWVIQLFNRKK